MRELELVLYRLKQHFGKAIKFVHIVTSSTDRETGQITNTEIEYSIRRAVLIPEDMRYITNQQVEFKIGDREIIIDAADISKTIQFGRFDYFLIDGLKYNLVHQHKLQDADGYYLHVRNLQTKRVD